jgi:hypothetical protein
MGGGRNGFLVVSAYLVLGAIINGDMKTEKVLTVITYFNGFNGVPHGG